MSARDDYYELMLEYEFAPRPVKRWMLALRDSAEPTFWIADFDHDGVFLEQATTDKLLASCWLSREDYETWLEQQAPGLRKSIETYCEGPFCVGFRTFDPTPPMVVYPEPEGAKR